ncbi:MAG: valine dehydrogenase [Actinobacteria bacterium]|nr:valine dehydrogenase [Actinomycetota bacterium]
MVRAAELPSVTHERVFTYVDRLTGLQAIIAIHSTALGPALGGTRFFDYANAEGAIADALRLSEGMTYKAAVAGLRLGGGNARKGQYVTAADVGTTTSDMDVIARYTKHVVGVSRSAGGSGDSGFSTASGVYQSMRVAARVKLEAESLAGVRVAVEGAGKVGIQLIGLLVSAGAFVVVADANKEALRLALAIYPQISAVDSALTAEVDVYAPCALGGTLTTSSVTEVRALVVCGAANNQLLTPEVDAAMWSTGIVWVPDFVANAGGLIQVAAELGTQGEIDVADRIANIGGTVSEILGRSARTGVTPGQAALAVAKERSAAPWTIS